MNKSETQVSFFGVSPLRSIELSVYHDESGDDNEHAMFLAQGALFVPVDKRGSALDRLAKARAGYRGRIHFADLRDNTQSRKGSVAWEWLNAYFSDLSHYCPFKCMIAHKKAPPRGTKASAKSYRLYNYTAMLAIRSALPWSFKDFDRVGLKIYSEQKSRPREDNFMSYVPRELARRAATKSRGGARGPQVLHPIKDVRLIPGDPALAPPEDAEHCELVQMTDLLTSAVSQAVNASAKQAIKIDLAHFVASWIEAARQPPWMHDAQLRRRFSVSCFDIASATFYDVPLAIQTTDQLSLFPDS